MFYITYYIALLLFQLMQLSLQKDEAVNAPKGYSCGPNQKSLYLYDDIEGELRQPYFLNLIEKEFREQGNSTVNILKQDGDQIIELSYSIEGKSQTVKLLTEEEKNERQFSSTDKLNVPQFLKEEGGMGRVKGGKDASEESSKGLALLGYQKEGAINWGCGGSIINDRWVMSASHCFDFPFQDLTKKPNQPFKVRLGEYDKTTKNDFSRPPTPIFDEEMDIEIEDVVFFPQHKPVTISFDIVLIKLKEPWPLKSNRIQPICLPWSDMVDPEAFSKNFVGTPVTMTGWGHTDNSSVTSDVLQEATVEVVDFEKCKESFSVVLEKFKQFYPAEFSTDNAVCSGSDQGANVTVCGGDSGGPLWMAGPGEGQKTQLGIVSLGNVEQKCGLETYPYPVYTPVFRPKYLKWIKEIAFGECDEVKLDPDQKKTD